MKKLYVLFLGCVLSTVSISQNPTYQQKLYYTCKVWGFVKYFHSNVSVCGVNWDSVLIHCLPLVKSAVTKNDFNDALDTMMNGAGPMALAATPACDTLPPALKRDLNVNWISDTSIFRHDIITILDTINNNFRPHTECWVQNNSYTNSYNGFLVFPYDSLMINANTYSSFLDEWHRIMLLYKTWNIINYFNPYNYLHNIPWDSTLYNNVLMFDNATNDYSLYIALRKVASDNNDAHTEGLTYDGNQWFPYGNGYSYELVLKYIPNKYVVVQSGISSIHRGDEIISVNGLTTQQWEDSLRPFVSAGDTSVFRRAIAQYMLCGSFNASAKMSIRDSAGIIQNLTVPRTTLYYSNWFYTYYPNDTLANVQWKYWSNCNIGYVNVGEMQDTGTAVANMYSTLQSSSAIIFDIRNYPVSSAIWDLVNYMYANQTTYATYSQPDVTYPGTVYWDSIYAGYNGNTGAYKGKVIILFNEQTQSAAENCCMILSATSKNVVKIGSQTAGTDGNVTWFRLSDYIQTGFTTLDWRYPNGDSTERRGIIPDSICYPTSAGIRAGRDEVLEKALQVAGCPLAVQNIEKPQRNILVFPNPSNGLFTIKSPVASGQSSVEVYNMLGQQVYSQYTLPNTQYQIDISNQPTGIYFYRVISENGNLIGAGKLIIVR